MWLTVIRCSIANIPHQRCSALHTRTAIRHPEFVVVTVLVTLLFASSAAAVRPPNDYDVVDYLSFVAYMGPTAHDCWTYDNLKRPNVYPGIMFARMRRDVPIYHGTVDGSWVKTSNISPNSFYGTNAWYPILHVLGKSYFTGEISLKNYKQEPQPLNDPRVLLYKVTNTDVLYLYAYDLFPEKFVKKWIDTEGDQSAHAKRFYQEQLKKPGMKKNIAGVKTISGFWNTEFKIPIQGFIQRRAVHGDDFEKLAKGVVGRRQKQSDGNLNGINVNTYFKDTFKIKFSSLFKNIQILQYDEVVYFNTPALQGSTPLDNPRDDQDAILKHVSYWLKACGTKTNDNPLPYILDYRTYWPWNNNPQVFQNRDQKLAVQELKGLDLYNLRLWNDELLKKLHSDLMSAGEYVEAKTFFFNRLVHSISANEYITSKDIAKIRFAAFDLLQRYCKKKDLTNKYYICNYSEVNNLPSHTSKIRITTEKDTEQIIEVDIQPAKKALAPWLF